MLLLLKLLRMRLLQWLRLAPVQLKLLCMEQALALNQVSQALVLKAMELVLVLEVDTKVVLKVMDLAPNQILWLLPVLQ